ncbi:MAG TPA: phosphohistidine phosphatase SixA [Candidatus Eisenbacteria bacterium]|jgi:phosphohistidine phosphatase|nr:phosphohistidine phosphatase SixA [Candidatus Eisenbacteria bacterium]
MELYFLRHAIAVDPVEYPPGRDSDRPLTPEGVKKMTRAAEGMQKLGLSFDDVLSSPYVRARHTAEIAAKGVGHKEKIRFTDAMTPGGSLKELLRALKEYEDSSKLLLVGHQPSIGEFVSELVTGQKGLSLDFKKGALCLVELDPGDSPHGRLKWFLTSRQLRAYA